MAYRSSFNDCLIGKTDSAKNNIIQQHMLAHYRRLYSAKCGVDTSTPAHFKPRYKPKPRPTLPVAITPNHGQFTSKDMKFLKSLTGEVKSWWNGCNSRQAIQYSRGKNYIEGLKENDKISSSSHDINHCISFQHRTEDADSNKASMSTLTLRNSPRKKSDLKLKKCARAYGISSKLRDMNVYHPPRRKIMTGNLNKHCGDRSPKFDSKGQQSIAGGEICPTSSLFANEICTVIEEQKEELLYLRFIQDITQDILNNEIYSNEGVMIIFKKHITMNREKLDRVRMLREVEKLGAEIGLPNYNYSVLLCPRRYSVSEDMGEYDSYEDYHPKVKTRFHSGVQKSTLAGDFTQNLNMSLDAKEMDFHKEREMFEKNKSESKVLGFLEEMGFDSNIAEEICVCMSDKDFTKFQFSSNETETMNAHYNDVESERDEFSLKKEKHQSKSVTELFHFYDAGFVFEDDGKAQTGILFDQEETLEMERILESINESDLCEDIVGKVKEITAKVPKNVGSERTSASNLQDECIKDDHSKKDSSEQINKETPEVTSNAVQSPMGSDYSSMKEHDSIYEGYSDEEQEEDSESASEVAEEIPEDLTQSSISSGISQITEKLKDFSMDGNPVIHLRTNEAQKA